MSVQPKQIEDLISHRQIWVFAYFLQRLKVGFSIAVVSDDFTIQNHLVILIVEGINNLREFIEVGESISRVKLNVFFSQISDGAVTIPFNFENPFFIIKRFFTALSQHRFDKIF